MSMKNSASIAVLCAVGAFGICLTTLAQDQGSGPGYDALQRLEAQAQAALNAGNDTEALQLGKALLQDNRDRTSWNYGNVVYDANQIMGLAALKHGKRSLAEHYLLAAGQTPGSPQLDSFGPDMKLAQALDAQGDTRVIPEFLDEVARFWAVPPANESKQFLPLYAAHAKILNVWKTQLANGQRPSLDRFDFSEGVTPPKPKPLLADGTQAPNFTVQDQDGKSITLSDYRGKVIVLDFWATWCGPCQESLPHTNKVAEEYKGKNVVVLAVNVWDTPKAFQAWLPQHTADAALAFAIDPTPNGKDVATTLYHVSGIPTQYVIAPDGKIVKSFVGYGGPTDDLANAIQAAMKQ
jgi:thiol-disulfide isomerase/thioredoxin